MHDPSAEKGTRVRVLRCCTASTRHIQELTQRSMSERRETYTFMSRTVLGEYESSIIFLHRHEPCFRCHTSRACTTSDKTPETSLHDICLCTLHAHRSPDVSCALGFAQPSRHLLPARASSDFTTSLTQCLHSSIFSLLDGLAGLWSVNRKSCGIHEPAKAPVVIGFGVVFF